MTSRMVRYTLLRLLVFFGTLSVLWLILWAMGRNHGPALAWIVVGAALISMVVSALVLRPFRDDLVREMEARRAEKAASRNARGDSDEHYEDAEAASDDYR
ncbi:DUF4229 domain-containing protein [Janibacter sp. GXQ6167]|uniref:DUF4229 domain-containing protein n=1 Tax=Janibacter sp. GXQ6167 TaxID=3240791 RepID=UPI00352401CA